MRKLMVMLLIALIPKCVYAVTEHIVQRGETIESIAKAYNVSIASLREANPAMSDIVYAGMILVIPNNSNSDKVGSEYDKQEIVTENTNFRNSEEILGSKDYHSNSKSDQHYTDISVQSSSTNSLKTTIKDFSGINVYYSAGFKEFKYGFYGLGVTKYLDHGFGGTASINANWGLKPEVTPGDVNILLKFGALYGYRLTDYLAVNASIRVSFITGEVYNKLGNTVFNLKTAYTATPGITIKINKLLIGFGYELGWCYDMKGLYHQAELSIGMCW